jgi:hypothetical protein
MTKFTVFLLILKRDLDRPVYKRPHQMVKGGRFDKESHWQ